MAKTESTVALRGLPWWRPRQLAGDAGGCGPASSLGLLGAVTAIPATICVAPNVAQTWLRGPWAIGSPPHFHDRGLYFFETILGRVAQVHRRDNAGAAV